MLSVVEDDLLTVEAVSKLTGLSAKAIRGRIERDSLRVVRSGGKVRIPLAELYRAGMIGARGDLEVSDLLDRLERLSRRLGELEAKGD